MNKIGGAFKTIFLIFIYLSQYPARAGMRAFCAWREQCITN